VKNNKRAIRRHQQERIKNRVKKQIKESNMGLSPVLKVVVSDRAIGRRANSHNAMCSCEMCGNPRYSKLYKADEKLTRQEQKANVDMQDELNENNSNK